MPYLPNVNSYLHQSSLLLEAYPQTTRITTKYSLPRRRRKTQASESSTQQHASPEDAEGKASTREPQPPTATLTLKTFEPSAGICLKYQTNKAAEVGRLMTGLGRLAKGEKIEEPGQGAPSADIPDTKMEIGVDTTAQKQEKPMAEAEGKNAKKKKKGKK